MNRLNRAWGESPFYQAQLKGPAPDRFYHMPIDPRTPNLAVAKMLAKGKLSIGEQIVDSEGELEGLWDLVECPSALHTFLHDFSWLRHATALDDAGKEPARRLLTGWLDRFEKWSPDAWTPYLTAERLTQLCCHGKFVLHGRDALWRSRVLTSMARQTRHLARVSHRANTGFERLMTAMGLTIAGLCLPGCGPQSERGLELLRRELRLQIRPDGGHISRNPSHQLSILIRLRMVLDAINARSMQAPSFLKHVSARVGTFLQLFRCGDGGLAVFNGGYEDDPKALINALENIDNDDSIVAGFARHSGFQRLEAGRIAVIADTGVTTRIADKAALPGDIPYKGASSFHFSSGRSRIVINCGSGSHLSADWSRALQKAPAHSCLSSDQSNESTSVLTGGVVSHRRGEDGRGQVLEIDRVVQSASGDKKYLRRFFVSAQGDDFRGQECLTGIPTSIFKNLALRFHLHPSVKASLARDGKSVILAVANHEGWRFRTNVSQIQIEKSIYCGEGGSPISTEQIVVRPDGLAPSRNGDIIIKWGFRRVDA